MNSPTPSAHPGTAPTFADWIFILIVIAALSLVAYLGEIAFEHAQQTEKSKRNGEALSTWLSEASAKRFEAGYAVPACAGGGDAKTSLWGACLDHLMKNEFKDMSNPFKGVAPQFIEACNPADKNLTGEIVLLKMTPTPPGSAIATVNTQLVAGDSIDQKLQLSIGICDKGSYLVKIADIEF